MKGSVIIANGGLDDSAALNIMPLSRIVRPGVFVFLAVKRGTNEQTRKAAVPESFNIVDAEVVKQGQARTATITGSTAAPSILASEQQERMSVSHSAVAVQWPAI